jgi:hypothetical protein
VALIREVDDGDRAQLILLPSHEHSTSDVKLPGISYWTVTSDGRRTYHSAGLVRSFMEIKHVYFCKGSYSFPRDYNKLIPFLSSTYRLLSPTCGEKLRISHPLQMKTNERT